jgi:hypothetical protein
MEIGVIIKVIFFILWPFLVLLLFYVFSKKKFLAKWEEFKKNGFFE